MVVATYVAEVPEITIDNGVACVRIRTGEETMCLHMPLAQFRATALKAHAVVANYDRAPGNVMPFKR